MVTLENFIKEEVNNHIQDVILRSIDQGKKLHKFKDEIVFNRYSLELLFLENQVIIYDDVFFEDEPLKLQLGDFSIAVSKAPNEKE